MSTGNVETKGNVAAKVKEQTWADYFTNAAKTVGETLYKAADTVLSAEAKRTKDCKRGSMANPCSSQVYRNQ